jgi:hypothetical protein
MDDALHPAEDDPNRTSRWITIAGIFKIAPQVKKENSHI